MKLVKFRYKDIYTNGKWNYQECLVDSVEECKRVYGLDEDPTVEEYEILSVEERD